MRWENQWQYLAYITSHELNLLGTWKLYALCKCHSRPGRRLSRMMVPLPQACTRIVWPGCWVPLACHCCGRGISDCELSCLRVYRLSPDQAFGAVAGPSEQNILQVFWFSQSLSICNWKHGELIWTQSIGKHCTLKHHGFYYDEMLWRSKAWRTWFATNVLEEKAFRKADIRPNANLSKYLAYEMSHC